MSDDWMNVFSDDEIEQLEMIAETVETELDGELDDYWMDLSIMFTMEQTKAILEALRVIVNSAWIAKRDEAKQFFTLLGYSIAQEYMDGDGPYDEPTADQAQFWITNYGEDDT